MKKAAFLILTIASILVLSGFASAVYYDAGPYYTTSHSGSSSYDKKTTLYERTAHTGYDYDGKYTTVTTLRETTRVSDSDRYSYRDGSTYIKPLAYNTGKYSNYPRMKYYYDYDRGNYPSSHWRYKPNYNSYTKPYYYEPRYNYQYDYYDWKY